MTFWKMSQLFVAVVGVVLSCQNVSAETIDVVKQIQTSLYSGNTEQAAEVAKARLAEVPDDDQARFALGAVQFFQAVEHLSQELYRYGLENEYQDELGLTGLPILRLPVPKNQNPEPVTYEALREVLKAFVSDLQLAEETLSGIDSTNIDLPLNLGLIRLDLDADGVVSDEEYLWKTFQRVANLPGLNERTASELLVDFDSSDVPWLQAYCHLLMGIAEFPLAHDWREVFDATFFGPFPNLETTFPEMVAQKQAWIAELKELTALGMPARPPYRRRTGETLLDARKRLAEWDRTPEGIRYKRIGLLEDKIWVAQIADVVAFVHLNHWPVVEPERMRNVLVHLETMVTLSRENWKRINAETDDRNEWIPDPEQSGALPGIRVTQAQVEGWLLFLDEFEALLQGKKLLPHWRFDKGINLRRIFTEPRTFDIVLLIQGTAATPYLEEGELTNEETWFRIMDLMGGQFFRYFIWFN